MNIYKHLWNKWFGKNDLAIYNQFIDDSNKIHIMLRDIHTNYMETYDWSLCTKGTLHLIINLGSKVSLDSAE